MDVLNISMQEALNSHVYLDIKLPRNGPSVSYLLYVDDIMFVGEWSSINAINLSRLLI